MSNKSDVKFFIQIALIVILVGALMYSLGKSSSGSSETESLIGTVSASDIIPTGVPSIYGEELKISFDDVSATTPQKADAVIGTLSNIDRSETLEGADLERYINVLYVLEGGISCEFCCGARSVIFEDGSAACGCAHSFAMRGLTKYLIMFHGDEYTDEELLDEVGKWKVLFFPGIHEEKSKILESQGIETNYINLASNKYRGIEQGQSSGGGMVGGC